MKCDLSWTQSYNPGRCAFSVKCNNFDQIQKLKNDFMHKQKCVPAVTIHHHLFEYEVFSVY